MARLLFLVLTSALVISPAAAMDLYHYTDSAGTLHFTNVPSDPRYRPMDLEAVDLERLRTRKLKRIDHLIEQASRVQEIDSALIKAVIRAESNFDAWAVSSAGAQGLMQLMPGTVQELQVSDPFDPKENIQGGTYYLRYLLDRFNQDLRLALAAYHAGPGNVTRHGGVPPFKATVSYLDKVFRFYEIYSDKQEKQSTIYRIDSASGQTLYTNQPERYSQHFVD